MKNVIDVVRRVIGKGAGVARSNRYHLIQVVPEGSRRAHGLNGYREVIETIGWGLEQLGFQVSHGVNHMSPDAINIIFGAQMLSIEELSQLPRDSIIYNFEQARNADTEKIEHRETIAYAASNFEIWDYSSSNLSFWAKLAAPRVEIVNVGYAPILTRIPKPADQDIDILLYGSAGEERLQAIYRLSAAGFKVMFVSGLYGQSRDDLIARAKIVLNIHYLTATKVFEVVRVSYLLANKKAVVAIHDADTFVEDDVRSAVRWSTMDTLVEDCRRLLDNDDERVALEDAGHRVIVERDITRILAAALGRSRG